MRSPSTSLSALNVALDQALSRFSPAQIKFGHPELLAKQAEATMKLANGLSVLEGQRNSAIKLATRFLKGESLDPFDKDHLAFVLCEVIPELDGLSIIGSDRLPFLIKHFNDEAKAGELWGPIWRALLISYFNFNPDLADTDDEKDGWESLGKLIRVTWPFIDKSASPRFIPSWLAAIRQEPEILGDRPAMKFAGDFLGGKTDAISKLTNELAIPSSSWFWHALVYEATEHAITQTDDVFKSHIPMLLEFIEDKRFYRDASLAAILERYFMCKDNNCNEDLKDYAIQSWKNPNAFEDGLSPGWNHVTKPVCEMVCSWVNENNLKDFFDILARRNQADVGRLNFWRQYIKQIRQTRFIFCDDTMGLRRRDAQVEKLIAREEGRYARYSTNKAEDAFMMQIHSYLIVEFSNQPNACYIYNLNRLPFKKNAKRFDGTTDDLKFGFHGEKEARIPHRTGWEVKAYNALQRLGIYPDPKRPSAITKEPTTPTPQSVVIPWRQSTTEGSTSNSESVIPTTRANSNVTKTPPPLIQILKSSPPLTAIDASQAPIDAPFTMQQLEEFVGRFEGLKMVDERTTRGGRLWILDQSYEDKVMVKLMDWGFEWGKNREGWYYNKT